MTYTEIMKRLYLEMAHVEGVIATDWESSQSEKEKLIDQLSNLKEAGYLSVRKLGNLDYRVHLTLYGIEWNERRERDIKTDIIQSMQAKSVVDTNKISTRTGWIALFIAGAAAIASVAQYFKKPDELIQQSLDTLNKEIKLLRQSLHKEVSNLKIHSIDTLNVKVSRGK